MVRRKTNKGKLKQKSNTTAKRMDDVENPQSDLKPQKTSWWSYIRHPTMIIDAFLSGIIWIQVIVYQKCAGRMPLFLKSKADDQEQQIKKLNGEKAQFFKQNKSLSDESNRIRNNNMELEKERENAEEEKRNLQKGNLELSDTITKLNRENENLKEGRKCLDKYSEELKKEIRILNERNQGLLKDKTSLEHSNADNTKDNKRLQSENTILREENDKQHHRNNQFALEVSKQKHEIQSLEQKNKNQAYDIDKADTFIKSLQQELWNFNVLVNDKDRIIQDLYGNVNQLNEEKIILEGEKQDALRRLSEQVSVKLRDNNPNIVDLSDPCRATKLAEMFGELYDNEWTDAFGVLEENLTEEQAIVVLLDTVLLAYKFCEQRVDEPWKTLEDWFLDKSLPGNQQTSKWLKDSRKVRIKEKVSRIEKIFTENVLRICADEELKVVLSNDDDLSRYFTKCIEVCLLMVTTDPPVVLVCPGWNVIQMESLSSQLKEEEERGEEKVEEKEEEEKDRDEDENSKPRDEINNVRQNTSDEKRECSEVGAKIEETTTTQNPMNDPHGKATDNENKEEAQGKSLQEVKEQYESGPPQSNDDPDKAANKLREETEQNEENGTNDIGIYKSKIEPHENNTLPGVEQKPPTHIDNISLFDAEYQSMPLQVETSNQTADHKTEGENLETEPNEDSGTNGIGEDKNKINRDENNTLPGVEQKSYKAPTHIDNSHNFDADDQQQNGTNNQTIGHKTEVEGLETEQNEDSGKNDIGTDQNNIERHENNTLPRVEQKPPTHIDNISLFDAEYQSMPLQVETSNQTADHKTEGENLETEPNEDSGTNGIGEDKNKINRDENNTLPGVEQESNKPTTNIDNSSLFDFEDQSMPVQEETSNETAEHKTGVENLETEQNEDSDTTNTDKDKYKNERYENDIVNMFASMRLHDETFNKTADHKVENLKIEQNEESGTNNIGEDQNNTERNDNIVPGIEQESFNQPIDIDNSSLFDAEDQSMPQEASNQTAENKIKVESLEPFNQMGREVNESDEGSRQVLKGNEKQQDVAVADDQIPNVIDEDDKINLPPHANSDRNNVISPNGLHGKSNDGLNGKTSKSTTVENMEFDKDLFKEYTSRGKFLDYVVWPAMRLHENGPLLSKGVAQGCKNKTKIIKDNDWTWVNPK